MKRFRRLAQILDESKFIGGSAGARYFFRSLMNSRSPVSIVCDNVRFGVRPRTPDLAVVRSVMLGEFDEAIAAAAVLQYGVVIDAGAYIGAASAVFARDFPDATIIALEPALDNFRQLVENTRQFKNVVPVNKALGGARGTVVLRDTGLGEWGYTILPKASGALDNRLLYSVEVTTIPELLTEYGLAGIDILKLDIEGAERELLADCPSWLNQTRVIVAELHDRLTPGCSDAWERATKNMRQISNTGEKRLAATIYP